MQGSAWNLHFTSGYWGQRAKPEHKVLVEEARTSGSARVLPLTPASVHHSLSKSNAQNRGQRSTFIVYLLDMPYYMYSASWILLRAS